MNAGRGFNRQRKRVGKFEENKEVKSQAREPCEVLRQGLGVF